MLNKNKSKSASPWMKMFIVLVILFFLFALTRFDARELWGSLNKIPFWTVVLLLGLQLITQLALNVQWCEIAKAVGVSIKFGDMFYINSQGAVVESVTPGVKIGGEVTRAVQISRVTGCSGGRAASVVALQKLFSMNVFFVVNLAALGYLAGRVEFLRGWIVQALIYTILLLFLSLFLCIFLMPGQLKKYLEKRASPRFSWALKIRGFLMTLLDDVISIRGKTGTWVTQVLLSFFIWLLYPVKLYFLAVLISPDVSIVYISGITFISYMVAMLPIFPGGLGGFEGAMTGLLLPAGFSASDAVTVSVAFRFVTFWFVMLFSAAFVAFYKFISGNNFMELFSKGKPIERLAVSFTRKERS